MGFQSGINAALGSIAGAGFAISKGLKAKGSIETAGVKGLMETANARAQEVKQKQIKQRRNFNEYLKKLETSFGGTVGDLPKSMQQTIAKQYSSKQRQEIMNKMDKEAKK